MQRIGSTRKAGVALRSVAAYLASFLVGFVFLAVTGSWNAIFVIIAAIQASDGKFYRYQ